MSASGVQSRLKSFDMYRKLPSELTEPTLSGAMVSIASSIIMLLLFISEFNEYLSINESSEMFVDGSFGSQKIKINLDMDFVGLPCDILSFDVSDLTGSSQKSIEGNLNRIRLTQDKAILKRIDDNLVGENRIHPSRSNFDFDRLMKAFQDKEGCKLEGYVFVNKVPGNFVISSQAYRGNLYQIFQQANIQTLDMSHIVNHLSFGDREDLNQIKKSFYQGILHPLDGTSKIKSSNLNGVGLTHQYYLSIVPTTYINLSQKKFHHFQFVVNSNDIPTSQLPNAFFKYDLSPVTVQFSQQREQFLHFIVQVCAIIGGVFAIAGIIDSLVYKSVVHILKKAEMGKLS